MNAELSRQLKHYRLSEFEYHKICQLLGREPRGVEWALFSALWSEHCSYKSSKIHLKKFAATLNSTVVNASGENAGIVDLGLGERVAFKMESHNHPSFIEPYQGAATGVGGILRDIFTMGARPVALADYLCFGETTASRMPSLMDGVVRGISGYGNCVGVPTVTGQTNFHSSYNQNILVNAMAVGLFGSRDRIALSGAKGVGNFVVYVGAKTGKDGVHGAAMASESFDENSEAKKPNVQIGDPYFEKLLIESCWQVIQEGLVVSIQDMGAAGLTSSSFEMASKGQVGLELHLDAVPLRDSSMTPEEILLSESQERMLLICEPAKFERLEIFFSQWGLDVQVVGKVLPERKVRLFWKKDLLTEMDPDLLVENAPIYNREFRAWDFPRRKASLSPRTAERLQEWILTQMQSAEHSSRKPIYQQYDQRVGAMTAQGSESDIALLRLPETGRGLAVAVGCRPALMRVDAWVGALDSVIYPSLQMALKGVRACAVTDCLNFGNPEKIEIMSEFVASVEAITEAAKAFETPVISGNVSFYNETQGVNITSTPATGLIGLRSNVEQIPKDYFTEENQVVFVLSFRGVEVSLEENAFKGEISLEAVRKFQALLLSAATSGVLQASQMVGLGGLALTLAKMTLNGMGFRSDLDSSQVDWLRGRLYQAVLASSESKALRFKIQNEIEALGLQSQVELQEIGVTEKSFLKLGSEVQIALEDLQQRSTRGLKKFFEGV